MAPRVKKTSKMIAYNNRLESFASAKLPGGPRSRKMKVISWEHAVPSAEDVSNEISF